MNTNCIKDWLLMDGEGMHCDVGIIHSDHNVTLLSNTCCYS